MEAKCSSRPARAEKEKRIYSIIHSLISSSSKKQFLSPRRAGLETHILKVEILKIPTKPEILEPQFGPSAQRI